MVVPAGILAILPSSKRLGRRCWAFDVAIPVKKIGKRHGVLYLNRDFAVVNPIGHNRIYINGELAQRGDEVYDGDILTLGGVYLRVRLEMGGNH